MAISRLLRAAAAVLAAAAAAAAASPALARAPSTPDQACLDWVLQRVAKDREAEKTGVAPVDPVAAYAEGRTPLGEWAPLVAVIKDTLPGKAAERDRTVRALVTRFAEEDKAKRIDAKAIQLEKNRIVAATLEMMQRDDTNSRNLVWMLQRGLLPQQLWNWEPGHPKYRIKQAAAAIQKALGIR